MGGGCGGARCTCAGPRALIRGFLGREWGPNTVGATSVSNSESRTSPEIFLVSCAVPPPQTGTRTRTEPEKEREKPTGGSQIRTSAEFRSLHNLLRDPSEPVLHGPDQFWSLFFTKSPVGEQNFHNLTPSNPRRSDVNTRNVEMK